MTARLGVLSTSRAAGRLGGPPAASMLEVWWPLSTDEQLRLAVAEEPGTAWSTFRLSKFYEALDALTGDVAYRHTDGEARGIRLVTAGHYHSRKLRRTDIMRDVALRCYLTATGNSSLELRTDAVQLNPHTGEEELVNVCHTTMVAVDQASLRPIKGMIPPLEVDGHDAAGQEERARLATWHAEIRRARGGYPLELRSHNSVPPTPAEMEHFHSLNRAVIEQQQLPAPRPPRPMTINEAS